MYCQKCGTEIGSDAKFCRKCGIETGTQSLTTTQAQAAAPPDYEKGIKKFMMGLAFLIIAIFPIFSRGRFWWWMLFPAVPLLAAGIAEFVRARQPSATRPTPLSSAAELRPLAPAAPSELPRARNTAELVPPPSVTEGTTRLLDKERAPRN